MLNKIDKFKLKGEWTIRFEDSEGNKVAEDISGTNIVNKRSYDTIFTGLGPCFNDSKYVAISSDIIPEAFNTNVITNTLAVGTAVTYEFVERDGIIGPYKDYECRINFTGTKRIFRTIGLVSNTPNNNLANITSTAFAYSRIDPVRQALTLDSITGNVLSFSSGTNLLFASDKLAGQYLGTNTTDLTGDSIITNAIINDINTGIEITVADGSLYTAGNTYYLINYPLQEDNVVLFVNYRISLDWDDTYGNTFYSFKYSFEKRIFNQGSSLSLKKASYGYGYLDALKDNLSGFDISNTYSPATTITESKFDSLHMYKEVYNGSLEEGAISDLICFGVDNDTNEALWFNKLDNYRAPIQNQFPHSSTINIPFYSSVAENLPNGSLKPVISDVSSNSLIPMVYKTTIDTPGGIGTATYKISKALATQGFGGNTFGTIRNRLVHPYLNTNNFGLTTFADFKEDNMPSLYIFPTTATRSPVNLYSVQGTRIPFGNYGYIECSSTGITVVDSLLQYGHTSYNSSYNSILVGLNITQVYVDYENNPDIIYIACKNKGLIKIVHSANTITNPSVVPCHGVDSLVNGNIIILNDNGIFSSADNYTTSIGDITGIDLEVAKFIKVDRSNITTLRLLICGKNKTDNISDVIYVWSTSLINTILPELINTTHKAGMLCHRFNSPLYDKEKKVFILNNGGLGRQGGNSSAGFTHYSDSVINLLYFDSDSTYIYNQFIMYGPLVGVYRESTFNVFNGPYYRNGSIGGIYNNLIYGNGVYKVNTAKDGLDIVQDNYAAPDTPSNINGTLLFNTSNLTTSDLLFAKDNYLARFSNNADYFTEYSWNGTSWVLDLASTGPGRLLHTSTESYINGLSISWEEMSPEEPFAMSTGEHFTTFVNKGLLKDNYVTQPAWNFYFVMRPTIEYDINITIPGSGLYQLPFVEDDSMFWEIISDGIYTSRLHNLEISGYEEPIELINIGTTPPEQNHITIDSVKDGLITFNSLDVGKTLTGKIIYTQKYHPTEV